MILSTKRPWVAVAFAPTLSNSRNSLRSSWWSCFSSTMASVDMDAPLRGGVPLPYTVRAGPSPRRSGTGELVETAVHDDLLVPPADRADPVQRHLPGVAVRPPNEPRERERTVHLPTV